MRKEVLRWNFKFWELAFAPVPLARGFYGLAVAPGSRLFSSPP